MRGRRRPSRPTIVRSSGERPRDAVAAGLPVDLLPIVAIIERALIGGRYGVSTAFSTRSVWPGGGWRVEGGRRGGEGKRDRKDSVREEQVVNGLGGRREGSHGAQKKSSKQPNRQLGYGTAPKMQCSDRPSADCNLTGRALSASMFPDVFAAHNFTTHAFGFLVTFLPYPLLQLSYAII